MPLPGGPANKLGNRYELWWTVLQLIRIMDGEAQSIRIEEPTADKAEFVLIAGGHKELHQAKRKHGNGKWSLASLREDNLLQAMFDQLSNNPDARFVFASGSDAPELKELTERARSAQNLEEYESEFVSAGNRKEHFTKLESFWCDTDPATAYGILQRIEVRTIDEKEIGERVRESLSARFLTEPDRICDALRSFTEGSTLKLIRREDLISELQRKGFKFRQLTKPTDAPALIANVTDRYLETTRRRLIQGTLIPRSSTRDLLAKIRGATKGTDCVLTGPAGGGKTGCAIECVEALRQGDSPAEVLAFRLDRIEPVSSTQELGARLGLEESPALVLATAAEAMSREAILVIDQLDAVSTTSGRRSDFFDLVEGLLSEVRGWRRRVTLHVVVVCRGFDWENDHRLRRLVTKDAAQISVTNFSLDEVKDVLTTSGFKTELFEARQLELLRLPQNLALFLDTHHDPDLRPTFLLAKDLFDQYWREKRNAVNARAATFDHWQGAIQTLCDEMTASQQLSVLKEKLDPFPNDYLDQMVSEGVLIFDGGRYGFGHESFFDYCFARGFVAKEESLADLLLASEQHLFRRAQVRQVLVYLRDADRDRYCKELRKLLTHEEIRPHLKDLAVALAVSLPDPVEDEWDVLSPWIESEHEAIKTGTPNSDRFATAAWNHFRVSQPWFQVADKRGLVTDWLTSDNSRLVDVAVDYVQIHQKGSGDRVTELLEPFVGRDGDWPQRLSVIMQWANLERSRRFFELFLRLIDDGTLDNTRGPIAVNSTFWSMLHSLAKTRPDWIAEVLAHWLCRRLVIVRQTRSDTGDPKWHLLFKHERGSKEILDAGIEAPGAFARHVLPVVLKIAKEAAYRSGNPAPKHDAVWAAMLLADNHLSMSMTCKDVVARAAEKLAEVKAEGVEGILVALCGQTTQTANFILLRAYRAGAKYFADEAVSELCNNTWRFQCGYSGNPYWVAAQLIEAVVPICSDENRRMIEQVILDYIPPYERTTGGYKFRGEAKFNLLSSIPPELRSDYAQARYMELERKFGAPLSPPKGMQVYSVGSPIQENAAEKMTDGQWLNAIKEYNSEEVKDWLAHPEKGGAFQLSQTLEKVVRQEPERFAHLSLGFPSGTHPHYLAHTLMGLKEAKVAAELKLKVCRKGYAESRDTCGAELADVLGSIEEPLPDEAVQMLGWLATEHPDPDQEIWNEQATGGKAYYGGDVLDHGINTVRGCAARAIGNLIQRDPSHIQRFRSTIERLVNDVSAAVRACAGSTLLVTVSHDAEFALEQFVRLVQPRGDQISDERLLTTHYVENFINFGLYRHFGRLRSVVERMLRSNLDETSEAGSRLASIAALLGHVDAETLVEEALRGNPSQRLGVAQVASANIGEGDHREWSEHKLLLFVDDDDSKVRQEAAMCFGHLESHSMEAYESLILRFCDSAAYQEDSFHLLRALEQSPYRLPGITLAACDKFLERFGEEARDIRTHRVVDGSTMAKLILRTYHQHQHDEWAAKCLDLIDRMCLERSYGVREKLDEYER